MKKILAFALAAVTCFTLAAGCGKKDNPKSSGQEETEYFVASELAKTDEGRVYMKVNGEPMLYTGAQVRIDGYVHLDHISFDEMGEQFEKAAGMNVNTVQLPICWADLEPAKDAYYFRTIGQLMEWALENNLKIELLWFTYQHGNIYCPSYIFNDEATYPKYESKDKNADWGEEGKVGYLVYRTPALLERERKAIKALTDYIYAWEKQRNFPVVITGYQIHNEADNFPRWGIDQQEVKVPDGSRFLTDREAWKDVYAAYDNAGKAFKSSKWRAVTRANLTTLTDSGEKWKEFAPDVFNLEGIDMVGDDTYTNVIASQKAMMANLAGKEFGYNNFAHVAENAANYANTASLILAAMAQGAGYLMYCLQLPAYWVGGYDSGVGIYDKWEQGVFDIFGNEKPHTAEVRSILYGLKNGGTQMAVVNPLDFAAFNVDTDFPLDEVTQEIKTRSVALKFNTTNKGIGYAVYYDGYVTLYCTQNASVELSNADFSHAEIGTFSGYEWTVTAETDLINGNRLAMQGGKIYRVKADNIRGALTSDTIDFIG